MTQGSSHQIPHEDQDNESDAPLTQRICVAVFFIVAGPLGLLFGPQMEDPKVFLWGVGTTLLYVGIFGLRATVSLPNIVVELGLEPHLETAAVYLAAARDILVELFQQPETYLVIFAIGLTIVVVGAYRIINWEPTELPGSDHDAE